MRRSEDWDAGLAEDLQDPEFARGFVMAAMLEEELPLPARAGQGDPHSWRERVRREGGNGRAKRPARYQSASQPGAGNARSAPQAVRPAAWVSRPSSRPKRKADRRRAGRMAPRA